jgi:hypothetical protein
MYTILFGKILPRATEVVIIHVLQLLRLLRPIKIDLCSEYLFY